MVNNGDFNPHSRTGSDLPIRSHDDMGFDFNPHSRTGSDLYCEEIDMVNEISIHTPARGVTSPLNYWAQMVYISIHTPARGVTSDKRSCYGIK